MIKKVLQENIIKRKNYVEKIFKYWDSKLIKVITGMRRAGKSYILKSIIQEIVKDYNIPIENIFYIDKELPEYKDITNYDGINKLFQEFLKKINSKEKIVIAIDEIQDIEEWEKFINGYLAYYGEKVEIFITGSNSTMLSSELSTLLSGRYIEFEISTLSLEEYSIFANKPITKELLEEYLQFGGLPGVFSIKNRDEGIIRKYIQDVYSTIVLKDIIKYFKVRNLNFFEELYSFMLSNVGNIVSSSSISDYLRSQKIKIASNIVLDYLSYGTKVYLLNKIKSVAPDTKKFFVIYNKYYVGDIGLRNAIVGYDKRKDIGKLLENYVFLELKRNGYSTQIGRLKSGKEIDFIAEKGGIIKYFQVCYLLGSEETIQREYGALEELKTGWEKYVISMDETNFGVSNGIKHIHFLDLHKIL